MSKSYSVILCLLIISLQSQAQQTFEKIYQGFWGNSVEETNDGGFAIVGTGNYGSINGGQQSFLIKTDALGDSLWRKLYGGQWGEEGIKILKNSDGGFILLSNTASFGAGSTDIFLLRTDSLGDTLWTKTYGYSNGEQATSFTKAKDGGYVIVCSASGTFPTIFKVDSNGFYNWGHLTPMIIPYSIKCTLDGGFIVVGWTGWSTAGWAVEKYDSSGAGQWSKYYGYSSTMDIEDRFRDVIQLPDSNYIVCGSAPLSMAKLNHINGDTLWTRNFASRVNGIAYTLDSNIIVADRSNGIYKFDTAGAQLWNKDFPDAYLNSIQTCSDGGFVATGSYFGSISQVLLIKTDSLGNVSSLIGIDENNSFQNNSTVFPNPVTSTSQLNFLNPKNETFHFSISDITGRINEEKEIRGSSIKIKKGNKPQGVYFYSLVNSKTGERLNGKFVVN